MVEVLVWVLILHSWDGGMLKIENIRSFEDCERIRLRAMASGNERRDHTNRTINGSCTQIGLLMPKPAVSTAPAITVNVPPQPAPVVNNRVIVRKAP